MPMLLVAVVAAAILIGAWLLALRTHLRRGHDDGAEWAGSGARPYLWTSAARCRRCGATGGVVDDHDGRISFSCLECGWEQTRHTRG
jgi:hypothetical protein